MGQRPLHLKPETVPKVGLAAECVRRYQRFDDAPPEALLRLLEAARDDLWAVLEDVENVLAIERSNRG